MSGGSVGMGASHEAEIHGNAASLHRAESVVGDAEPIAELTETMGQTGESAPGPGLMDEFVPEVDREEPHGDSQDTLSRSVGQADSGSKIYGYTKADSVESGEKIGHATGNGSSMRPSLSCNAGMCAGFDLSKDDVTQTGKILTTDDALMGLDYDPGNGLGTFIQAFARYNALVFLYCIVCIIFHGSMLAFTLLISYSSFGRGYSLSILLVKLKLPCDIPNII
jgi:hypothetical protein